MRLSPVTIFIAAAFVFPDPAAAVTDEAFEALKVQVERLNARVEELSAALDAQQRRARELAEENRSLREAATARRLDALPEPSRPRPGGTLGVFNPDIGLLTDITAQATESSDDGEANDRISVREMELLIGHDIDPYARMDATVAFSDFEEVSLEEAYITTWAPWFNAKIGRILPRIGKANALHRDQLKTVDEPRVIESYLGAEGLSRTGVELSSFLPAPWEALTHEWIAGVMEGGIGEGGTLFGATRRRPSLYARLRNFWEASDATSADAGATYLTGSADDDSHLEVRALGLDAALTHYVTPNNPLTWQNEAYLQWRGETAPELNNNPWGFYSLLDYRLNPRFSAGGRYDWLQPVDLDRAASPREEDQAFSGYLTFHQSEFARWRFQAQHVEFAEGGNDNRFFLQGTFVIGVHKHAIQ